MMEHPRNPKLKFNYALALAQNARWTEARDTLLAALELAPDFPAAHLRLAMVYMELGEKEKAEMHFGIARSLGAH